ncbi:MAG: putative metal-binding motif-containing protein [Sandaracinus sp.]
MRGSWCLAVLLGLVVGCSADSAVDVDGAIDTGVRSEAGTDAGTCTSDATCDDHVFCNGAETCGAGGRCVGGSAPCAAAMCDEATDRCSCATPDMDGDGARAIACGGDDCDDGDARRSPRFSEACDAMDVDEDCDPTTFGFRDADGDGVPDANCCNRDSAGTATCGEDCNDTRPGVSPMSPEVCDGLDDDCDGATDEGVLHTYYRDDDGDGYGVDDAATNMQACFTPVGFADRLGDCNDTVESIHPGLPDVCDAAMVDDDCSGVPNDPPSGCSCTGAESRNCVASGVCASGMEMCSGGTWGMCSIMPVSETCDGRDEDCDGTVDDGVQTTCFADGDLDGYPVAGAPATLLCPASGGFGGCPTGFTTRLPMGATLDCDDGRYASSPAGVEVCNGIDDDCDGTADEMLTVGCYLDVDNDTYPAAGAVLMSQCSDPTRVMTGLCPIGWTNRAPATPDCDDANPSRSPAATEICDTVDQDCDAIIDETVSVLCYPDPDGDLYTASGATTSRQCRDASRATVGFCPITYTDRAPTAAVYDCNPTNAAIHPGATENCSLPAVDEDCDGMANPTSLCACGDGMVRACTLPGVCMTGTEQCTSGAWGACSVAPVTETCDGRDEDCDGTVDDGLTVTCYADGDNDTYARAGSAASALCPVAGRAAVGGCPVNFTNRVPGATTSDCNDSSSAINPAATEICSDAMTAADEDCDTLVDEMLRVTCYSDGDSDTYAPSTSMPASRCIDPTRGAVGFCPPAFTNRAPGASTTDCNDLSSAVHPGAAEICDRVDSDCSSGGALASDEDADADGHAPTTATCSGGFVRDDCRDDAASIYPGATEICDRIDSNCSSGGTVALDEDGDGDGAGRPGASCTGGFLLNDCADNNPNVFPGQPLFFGTPYCTSGIAPIECGSGSWYCDGPGNCPPVCGGCAPLTPATFDYDCSGSNAFQPVQSCTGHAGNLCVAGICQSGPNTAGSVCGAVVAFTTCSCDTGLRCGAATLTTGRRGCH